MLTTKGDADFISQRAFPLALQKDVATRTWSTHVTFSLSAPVSAWWGKEFRCQVTLIGLWAEDAQGKQKYLSYSCSDAAG